jgi:hypothetical protein
MNIFFPFLHNLEIKTGLDFSSINKSNSQSSVQLDIIIMAFLAPNPENKQCQEVVDDPRRLKKRAQQSSGCHNSFIPDSLKKLPYGVDSNSKSIPFANGVDSIMKLEHARTDKIKKTPQKLDTTTPAHNENYSWTAGICFREILNCIVTALSIVIVILTQKARTMKMTTIF